ncbi:MAG: ABC transporter ATP-binding protein [Planctomycetota bacterium]
MALKLENGPQAGFCQRPDNSARLRRLVGLAFQYRRECAGILALQTVLVLLTLGTLGLTGLGIDYLSWCINPSGQPPAWPMGLAPPSHWSPRLVIAVLATLVVCTALLTAFLKFLNATASAALSQKILICLRTDLYTRLQRLSLRFHDAGVRSSLINRAGSDANQVRQFVDGVALRVLTVLLTLGVYLLWMLRVHAGLTLACLASTPLLWLSACGFSRVVQPAYRRAGELSDDLIRLLVENIQGVQVVKGFAREQQQAEQFEAATRRIQEQRNSIFRSLSLFQPAMGMLTQLNLLVLIGYGGRLVIRGELSAGAGLFVFAGLLQEFAAQVAHITNIANSIQASLASADRVFEVLDAPIEISSAVNAERLPALQRAIDLEGVSFEYVPGRPVLRQISLRIRAGECIGITGPVGSGKSTLLALLKRFYDPTSGRILFDGCDLRERQLEDVRKVSGIVFQDSFLFTNSIAANIAFGRPDATPDEIAAAARTAAAEEFIRGLPDGFETLVGEHGCGLSGGQRQRLALARALLLNPSLLLLDDAASAVDPETEQEIRSAMEQVMHGCTSLVVSGRISTLRRTDRIVVLSEGRIEAVGTHAELLRRSPWYRQLNELQNPDPVSAPAIIPFPVRAAGRRAA